MLKSCIQLSAWPRTTNTINSVSINHVACVVVAAAINPRPGGVHVTDHPRLGMNEYLSLLERYGFKVPEGSYDAGRTNSRQDQEQHALMLLYHFCINYLPAAMRAPEFDGRSAVEILKADTENWTEINESPGYGISREGMGRSLTYLAEIKFVNWLPGTGRAEGHCLRSISGQRRRRHWNCELLWRCIEVERDKR
jgi:L-2-aminoadipate reductase